MWEECCFMPGSRSERDKRMNDRIIDHLEKALLLDRGLPFPTEEYILLCRLNGREPEAVADVPVYEDSKLANTLSKLEIGDMIPPELYSVVAEILVFVDDMDRLRSKVKKTGK